MWIGCFRVPSPPRPRSFTPSLGWWIQRDWASSRTVMGRVGSMRPWSIHSWMRSRFAGARSGVKLQALSVKVNPNIKEGKGKDKHVCEPTLSMNHNFRRLSTIEPRGDLSMLLLTLMTPTGRLSLPRSRTPTASSLFTERSRVIGKRSEDVGVAALRLQLREQERQW